jgi:hypothetical protein
MWFKGRENATKETERKSGCILKFSGLHPIPLFRGGGKLDSPEKNHRQHALNYLLFFSLQKPALGQLVWELLEKERVIELNHLAAALVRYYLAKEQVIDYLDTLLQRDLDHTGQYSETCTIISIG